MKIIVLTLAIGMIPVLLGMTFRAPIHAQVKVETADEWQDYSCTTDRDCECKVVPYEAPNNSPECLEYRKQSVAMIEGAK